MDLQVNDVEPPLIKADEVDEPPPPPEAYSSPRGHAIPEADGLNSLGRDATAQQHAVPDPTIENDPPLQKPLASRPSLRRDSSLAMQQTEEPTDVEGAQEVIMGVPTYADQYDRDPDPPQDSLSLGQLKKLLQDMPRAEPTSYAFEYADSSSFEEELEELFDYSAEERQLLLNSQKAFAERWAAFKYTTPVPSGAYQGGQIDWQSEDAASKIRFLHLIKAKLLANDSKDRLVALQCAVYVALGCWMESAGSRAANGRDSGDESGDEEPYVLSKPQVSAIHDNVQMISAEIGVDTIYEVLRGVCDNDEEEEEEEVGDDDGPTNAPKPCDEKPYDQCYYERWACLVLLYLAVDIGRRRLPIQDDTTLREEILKLQPKLLSFLLNLLVRSRWDEAEYLPQEKLLSLCWKTILLEFGGVEEVNEIRQAFRTAGGLGDPNGKPLITASPLDYHLFRQEITSKYPAFNPPPPLFPFEADSSSMIPSFSEVSSRVNSISNAASEAGTAHVSSTTTSIMQQPVHIATPAPSPPPSPAGPGGKGIKKQNYQTNQMFPFLYPPLDQSSNDLGGKGTTELQDLFAGRKWHGSDIPASILEAADLFSKRMKATRAMKQLWQTRVNFLKFERGQDDIEGLDLDTKYDEAAGTEAADIEDEDLTMLDDDKRRRLEAVDRFYEDVLPHLQSVVIVLLKVLLQAVTTLITQPQGVNGLPNGEPGGEESGQQKPTTYPSTDAAEDEVDDASLADLSKLRVEEISGKAVAGILLLLLKWFKISHVLKFEYLSQLLLDSNYIQLILKLFTHQELERSVAYKCERRELNFFSWCRAQAQPLVSQPTRASTNSTNVTTDSTKSDENFSSDAEPPPIRLSRHVKSPEPIDALATAQTPEEVRIQRAYTALLALDPEDQARRQQSQPPAIDELGIPLTGLPSQPITHYSWRAFFTLISHLRILQKLVKNHPHRQLLMVSLKTTLVLKRLLRIPHDTLRLYTLKVIKGQVPYCHRKWRAGNMKIITGIYLNVKPGLRDDWLTAGGGPGLGLGQGLQSMNAQGQGDLEESVEGALMGERAWRGLAAWWHAIEFPEQMGVAEEERESKVPNGYKIDLTSFGLEGDEDLDDNGHAGTEAYEDGDVDADADADVDAAPLVTAAPTALPEPPTTEDSRTTTTTTTEPAAPILHERHPGHRIPDSFATDYDPFSTRAANDPSPLPVSAFLTRDTADPSSTSPATSRSSSRRSSTAALLHDPAREDFFLTELSRMGVIGRSGTHALGARSSGPNANATTGAAGAGIGVGSGVGTDAAAGAGGQRNARVRYPASSASDRSRPAVVVTHVNQHSATSSSRSSNRQMGGRQTDIEHPRFVGEEGAQSEGERQRAAAGRVAAASAARAEDGMAQMREQKHGEAEMLVAATFGQPRGGEVYGSESALEGGGDGDGDGEFIGDGSARG